MRILKIMTLATALSLSQISIAADLSDADIQKWVTAATALQSWGKQHASNEVIPEGQQVAAMKNPAHAFTQSINEAKKSPHFGDVQGVLKQNGYANADEWAQLGDRIITAHFANAMSKHQAFTPDQLGMAMKQMEDNPNIPAHLRAQMEQAMQGSQAIMEAAKDAPAADKAAVLRNAGVLEKFFKAR